MIRKSNISKFVAFIVLATLIITSFSGILAKGDSYNASAAAKKTKKKVAAKKKRPKKLREAKVVRVAHFPNITHSQAIVGLKQGFFQRALGPGVKIEVKTFNAGPSEIEALFAGAIDIGYIGPNPAINGYTQSGGKALRVIAGATSAGASFVVRKDAGINKASDLANKKVASPQLGNTQDVALKNYITNNGLKTVDKGGNVEVVNIENPDILTLFKKKQIAGAWVPEPWAARLVKDGNGQIFLDERTLWPKSEFVTANIIVSKKFLDRYPGTVQKFLKAHVETTGWINRNLSTAVNNLNAGIEEITGKRLDDEVINNAFSRLKVTWDPVKSSLFKSADAAFKLGYIKNKNLKNIYDLRPLNDVLKKKGLKQIK